MMPREDGGRDWTETAASLRGMATTLKSGRDQEGFYQTQSLRGSTALLTALISSQNHETNFCCVK